jgi:hypothetical protein
MKIWLCKWTFSYKIFDIDGNIASTGLLIFCPHYRHRRDSATKNSNTITVFNFWLLFELENLLFLIKIYMENISF